jgi:hypothetical protein
MVRILITSIGGVCVGALFAMSVGAAELTANQIMLLNETARKAQNEVSNVTMILRDNKGSERRREVVWIADDSDELSRKSLIRFRQPQDVAGTGLLSIEHDIREDERWLYLPALRKVRRIAASDKSESFMGTDFAFEDLSIEDGVISQKQHKYRVLGSEVHDGFDCYIIEALPATEKEIRESGYSKREIWITKDRYIAIYAKYWNKDGELIKHLKSIDVRQTEDGSQYRSHQLIMENFRSGHTTTFNFDHYLLDQNIDSAKIFTQRFLESGA